MCLLVQDDTLGDVVCFFFFQAEDGIRDLVRSRGLGDVYKRQGLLLAGGGQGDSDGGADLDLEVVLPAPSGQPHPLSLIHI